MKRTLGILSLFSLALLGSASVTPAQKIKPTDKQISIKWGQVSEDNDYDVVVIGGTPAGVAAVFLVGCGESSSELLLQSVVEGNVKAVKQHLAVGADVNAKNRYGSTPLHRAAYAGHKEIAELLIAKGADVNAKNGGWGRTPLHVAAIKGQKEIAELLIDKGADVNTKNIKGQTPLHAAVNEGHKEVVELFVAEGVDVNAKNRLSLTPLDFAITGKQPETADLLRKHGGKTRRELKAKAK